MSYIDNLVLDLDMSTINPVDLSGNGNNGTGVGLDSTNIVNGFNGGKCLSFNGIDEGVTVPYTDDFVFGLNDFSISVWCRTTSVSVRRILSTLPSPSAGKGWFSIQVVNASRVDFEISGGVYLSTAVGISDGEWHHIVCVRGSGTNASKIYIDGVEESSGTNATDINSNAFLRISGSPAGANLFLGEIDNIDIFNSALTATQVADIYRQQKRIIASSRRLKEHLILDITLNSHTDDLVSGVTATPTALTYTEGPFGRSVGVFNGSAYVDHASVATDTVAYWIDDTFYAYNGTTYYTDGEVSSSFTVRSTATRIGESVTGNMHMVKHFDVNLTQDEVIQLCKDTKR